MGISDKAHRNMEAVEKKKHYDHARRINGAQARRVRELADRLALAGETPLDVMINAMRIWQAEGNLEMAVSVARDAAPYMHPRLSSVTGKMTLYAELSDDALAAALARYVCEDEPPGEIAVLGTAH